MKRLTKILGLLVLLLLPFLSYAQEQGIHFEQGLSWEQVLDKAKAEHKYIFVDCFATWCSPCKLMDATVYPVKQVGDYYNDHFISVKIQMDKTREDNDDVKKWYQTATVFTANYTVNAYPTFLFFSPEGKPVHKHTGSETPDRFTQLGEDALTPEKQYYNVLKNYQPGNIDTAELKGLARSFSFTDKDLARKMALDYLVRLKPNELLTDDNVRFVYEFQQSPEVWSLIVKRITAKPITGPPNELFNTLLGIFNKDTTVRQAVSSYMHSLSQKQLHEKDNLILITDFFQLIRPGDRYFHLLDDDPVKTDTIMHQKDRSEGTVDNILIQNFVMPANKHADSLHSEPDWKTLSGQVEMQTSHRCAERSVVWSKAIYYQSQLISSLTKDTARKFESGHKEATAFVGKIKNDSDNHLSPMTGNLGNNVAFEIFKYSDDQGELEAALKLDEQVLAVENREDGNQLDTKANLLYKLGKKEEAIRLEEHAAQLSPTDQDIQTNLQKMKQGLPTWPIK